LRDVRSGKAGAIAKKVRETVIDSEREGAGSSRNEEWADKRAIDRCEDSPRRGFDLNSLSEFL
jgi:hypothetical protein